MDSDPIFEPAFWLLMAAFACVTGALVWFLSHAPFAQRARLERDARDYTSMSARGQSVVLPRTWRSEGFAGHHGRSWAEVRAMTRTLVGLGVLIAVLGLFLDPARVGETSLIVLLVFGLAVVVAAGFYVHGHIRVRRRLREAAEVPREAFNIAANAHGLFVPVSGGRVIEGAWGDWTVVDAAFRRSAKGQKIVVCERLTLRHRGEPDLDIPIIATLFPDGESLMDVIAARVAWAVAPQRAHAGGDARAGRSGEVV